MTMLPNQKSPESTAIAAAVCPQAVLVRHIAVTRWLGVMSEPIKKFPWWTVVALLTAVLGNIIATLIPARILLQIPPGSVIRLWAENLDAFLVSVATFVIVILFAIVGIRRERHRMIAIIAICLALTPWFLSGWVEGQIATMRWILLD